MSPASPKGETFKQRFCRQYGIPESAYTRTALRLTLYPHATWLRYFAGTEWMGADRRFLAGLGELTSRTYLPAEIQDYRDDRANRHFWRRSLKLRVSVRRVGRLFASVWGNSGGADAPQ